MNAEPLGNDLVWLSDPDNVGRSDDQRLLQRILTARERLLVAVAPEPDFMLWSLWAAKEAAYKAWSRGRLRSAFSPVSFAVEFAPGAGTARVVQADRSIAVRWTRGPDWVHAVACDQTGLTARVENSSDPSRDVRLLASRLLNEAGGPVATVEGRPPVFLDHGVELAVPLSLSHDGPYVAAVLRWSRVTNASQP